MFKYVHFKKFASGKSDPGDREEVWLKGVMERQVQTQTVGKGMKDVINSKADRVDEQDIILCYCRSMKSSKK